MRRAALFVSLFLVACEGRYVLGDLSVRGRINDPRNTTPDPPVADAGTEPDSGSRIVAPPPRPRTSTRWLASVTFTSSTSTQTALSFIDLQHPDAAPFLVESQSAIRIGFSPDGTWYSYASYRGNGSFDIKVVNLTGDKPGQPQFAVTTDLSWACAWAPDSRRIACFNRTELVYADLTTTMVGPMRTIGSVPARPAPPIDKSGRELMFLDGNTLVYSHGPNDFARVEWSGTTPSSPKLLGVGGGLLMKQSPDRGRALLQHVDPGDPPGHAVVDFRAGKAQVIDPATSFVLSDSFESAVGTEPGTHSFYSVNGVSLERVGQQDAEPLTSVHASPQLAGRVVLRRKGDRVVMVTVGETGIAEKEVPGDYQGVNVLRIDPAHRWLYIGTADLDEDGRAIESSIKHWLSRVGANGPEPAQSIGQGYALDMSAGVFFSPDSQRLALYGYDAYPRTNVPIAFRLFDLKDPARIQSFDVAVSLSWAETTWSSDSTYLSVVGGSMTTQTRDLFVIDALTPTDAPRKIIACGPSSPSGPTCPNSAAFQP